MPPSPASNAAGPFSAMPKLFQWLLLAAGSAVLVFLLTRVAFPAALLIGPMLSSLRGHGRRDDPHAAQPLRRAGRPSSGCLVATSIDVSIFSSFLSDWPIILLAVASTLLASSFLGWSISRLDNPAGLDRRVGLRARRRDGDGADGRCVRRRCPPRRLHAVSARRHGHAGRRLRRAAMGRHLRTSMPPHAGFRQSTGSALAATLGVAAMPRHDRQGRPPALALFSRRGPDRHAVASRLWRRFTDPGMAEGGQLRGRRLGDRAELHPRGRDAMRCASCRR